MALSASSLSFSLWAKKQCSRFTSHETRNILFMAVMMVGFFPTFNSRSLGGNRHV